MDKLHYRLIFDLDKSRRIKRNSWKEPFKSGRIGHCGVITAHFLFISDCTERDIFFAIDGGASVGPENFRKQVKFLEQFVQNVDLGSKKIRVGLLEISNKEQTKVIFSFGSSQNPFDIQYLLSAMPYYNKPERYVGEAMKKIYNSASIERR